MILINTQITIALTILIIAVSEVHWEAWWGYNARLYEFASVFLTASAALFGTFSLTAYKTPSRHDRDITFVILWIDTLAAAFSIASGVVSGRFGNVPTFDCIADTLLLASAHELEAHVAS